MKSKLLLPNKWKKIGWIILIPATIAGIFITITGYEASFLETRAFVIMGDEIMSANQFFSFISVNLTNTIAGCLFIIGALLVSFSKEKQEDEFIANLRLTSMQWSVLVSYVLLLFAFIFVYGSPFFTVMIYNMFTVLIIFIIRFNYILFRSSKMMIHEK